MAARNPDAPAAALRWARPVAGLAAILLLFAIYPPFRVVPPGAPAAPSASAAFDPAGAAAAFWNAELQPAARDDATELGALLGDLRADFARARTTHGRTVGVGGRVYFFVRGTGRVAGRERNALLLEPTDAPGLRVALRTGPVFGNAVRDGTGRLDVNDFPGLTEFNALAAELNRLVEERVLPVLRADLAEGAVVEFAGVAEAPAEAPAGAGAPALALVPVRAAVR